MKKLKPVVKWLGIAFTSILIGFVLLLLVLLFFPLEYFLPHILSEINTQTGIKITVNSAHIRLVDSIEFYGIKLEPPKGFKYKPIYIKRLQINYSLIPLITQKKFIINNITIDNAQITVESLGTQQNSLSVLLERFTSSENNKTKPKVNSNKPKSKKSGFVIDLKRFTVNNLCATFLQVGSSAQLCGLNLFASATVNTSTKKGKLTVRLDNAGAINALQNGILANIELPWQININSSNLRNFEINANMPIIINALKVKHQEISSLPIGIKIKAALTLKDNLKPLQVLLKKFEVYTDALKLNATAALINKNFWQAKALNFYGRVNLPLLVSSIVNQSDLQLLDGYVEFFASGENIALTTNALPHKLQLCVKANNITLSKQHDKLKNANFEVCASNNKELALIFADAKIAQTNFNNAKLKNITLHATDYLQLNNLTPTITSLLLELLVPQIKTKGKTVQNINLSAEIHTDIEQGALLANKMRFSVGKLIKANIFAQIYNFGRNGEARIKVNIPSLEKLKRFAEKFKPNLADSTIKGKVFAKASANWKFNHADFVRLLPPSLCNTVAQKQGFSKSDCNKSGKLKIRKLPGRAKAEFLLSDLEFVDKRSKTTVKQGFIKLTASVVKKAISANIEFDAGKVQNKNLALTSIKAVANAQGSINRVNAKISFKAKTLKQKDNTAKDLNFVAELQTPLHNLKPKIFGSEVHFSLQAKSIALQRKTTNQKKGVLQRIQNTRIKVDVKANDNKIAVLDAKLNIDKVIDNQTNVNGISAVLNSRVVLSDDLKPQQVSAKFNSYIANFIRQGLPFEFTKNSLQVELSSPNALREVELRFAKLKLPAIGLSMRVSGKVNPFVLSFVPFEISPEPNGNLNLDLRINAKNGLNFKSRQIKGEFGVSGSLELAGKHASIAGKIFAHNFYAKLKSVVKNRTTNVEVSGLELDVPFEQKLVIKPQISLAKTNSSALRSTALLYDQLREYSPQRRNFVLQKLIYQQSVNNQVVRKINIEHLEMDVRYAANTFAIDRLHLRTLGGDAIGRLRIELNRHQLTRPKITALLQVSGMNLAYLEGTNKKPSKETEVSAIMRLKPNLLKRSLSGRIDITEISLKQLDELLLFIDPQGKDPKIQKNRQTLKLARLVKPRVDRVAMWIEHENLNMDIKVSSLPLVEQVIQGVLNNLRLRRYSIAPILKRYLPEPTTQEKAQKSNETASNN